MKVIIVGSGVIGLSTAHALLDAGCDVTVCDAQAIPNPASASYDRSRMMRLQYGTQRGYAHLARRALLSWIELERALGVQLYRPTGICVWSATAEAWTSATPGALNDAGIVHGEALFLIIWATLAVCVVLSVSAFIAAAIASLPTR
jgi:glycine/D-amino acid oxidase-like deaminating enzyme